MDSVKTDNERELTSTMGNVLSMSSKDEKNDTSDATPTSSTDANTTTTASQIVSDDPISSTSTDIIEQSKSRSTEASMQNSVEVIQTVSEDTKKSSTTDAEADLLEMSISNISSEKITEDVEDLVHDLESLLGESTDSFNIPVRRKGDTRSSEEKDEVQPQTSLESSEGVIISESLPEINLKINIINEDKVEGSIDSSKTNKIDAASVEENEVKERPQSLSDTEKNICSSGTQSHIECETSIQRYHVEEPLAPGTRETAPEEVQKTVMEDVNIKLDETKEILDVEIIKHGNVKNKLEEGETETSTSVIEVGDSQLNIIADKIPDSLEETSNKSEHFPVESSKSPEENDSAVAHVKENTAFETPTIPEEESKCREHKTEEVNDAVHSIENIPVQLECSGDDATKLELANIPTEENEIEQSLDSTEQNEYGTASERCDSTEEKMVTSKAEVRDCEQVDGTVTDVEENKMKITSNEKSDDIETENPTASTNQCENNPILEEVIIEDNKSSDSNQINIPESGEETISDNSGDTNVVKSSTTPPSKNTSDTVHELCKDVENVSDITVPESPDGKKDTDEMETTKQSRILELPKQKKDTVEVETAKQSRILESSDEEKDTDEVGTVKPNQASEEISKYISRECTETSKPEPEATNNVKEDAEDDASIKNVPSEANTETVIPDSEAAETSDSVTEEQAEIVTEEPVISEVEIEEMSLSSQNKEEPLSEELKESETFESSNDMEVIIEEYPQEVKSTYTEVTIEELLTFSPNATETYEGVVEMPTSPVLEISTNDDDTADDEPELIPNSPAKDNSEITVIENIQSPEPKTSSAEHLIEVSEDLKTDNSPTVENPTKIESVKNVRKPEDVLETLSDVIDTSLTEEATKSPVLKDSANTESLGDDESADLEPKSFTNDVEKTSEVVQIIPEGSLEELSNIEDSMDNLPPKSSSASSDQTLEELANSELTNKYNENIVELEIPTKVSETEVAAKSESSRDIEVVEPTTVDMPISSKALDTVSTPEPSGSSKISLEEEIKLSSIVENTSSLSEEVPLCVNPKEINPEVNSSTSADLESLQIENANSEITGVVDDVPKINEESNEVPDIPNIKELDESSTEESPQIENINSEITGVVDEVPKINEESNEIPNTPNTKELGEDSTEESSQIENVNSEITGVVDDVPKINEESNEVADTPNIKELDENSTEESPQIENTNSDITGVVDEVPKINEESNEIPDTPNIKELDENSTEEPPQIENTNPEIQGVVDDVPKINEESNEVPDTPNIKELDENSTVESPQIENANSEITEVVDDVPKINEGSNEVPDTPNINELDENSSEKIVEVDNLKEPSNLETGEPKININLETDVMEVNAIDIKMDETTKEPLLEIISEKVETITETIHMNQKNETEVQETTQMVTETVSHALYNEQRKDVDIDENITVDKCQSIISKDILKGIDESEAACISLENMDESIQHPPEEKKSETSVHMIESTNKEIEAEDFTENINNGNSIIERTDKATKFVADTTSYPQLVLSEDSDSEDIVPRLVLDPKESIFSPKKSAEENDERTEETEETHTVNDSMPEIEDILADQNQSSEAEAIIDMQENLETILAVASLQNAESSEAVTSVESQLSESERREMEAIRKAVESITEAPAVDYDTNVDTVVGELIKDVDIPVEDTIMNTEEVFKSDELSEETEVSFIQDAVVDSEQVFESLPQDTGLSLLQEEVLNNVPSESVSSIIQEEITESEEGLESIPIPDQVSTEDSTHTPADLNVIESSTSIPDQVTTEDSTHTPADLNVIESSTSIPEQVITEDSTHTLADLNVIESSTSIPDQVATEDSTHTSMDLNVIESIGPVETLQESDNRGAESIPNTSEVESNSLPDTSDDKIVTVEATGSNETKDLPDSSDVTVTQEEPEQSDSKEKDCKPRVSERPKRHKKSTDNKLEELSINTDVPEKEKHYSPKVTIKPIKVPDEEVSTTSNSDTEIGKGSLKMTITKQSDKMHSILKICEPENSEVTQEQDEPIPKLIIKPKMQQVEQQHSPKMSTRSSKQGYSPTSTTQRSGSPRITIKPVVKPEKAESVSPLKIKIGIKPEETSRKHSPKLNIKPVTKPEDEVPKENVQSPIKVTIKPVVKPTEEIEPVHSPRITIKPIPKPEEKESDITNPRLSIKPVKKQDDEEQNEEKEEKERPNPKVTIKPIAKPQEPDTQSLEVEDEVKERIVLKINKGNLPTPPKESKKREHPPDDDKSEKLAKITVKFSREGGHPHIVQQPEDSNKRSLEEQPTTEKTKKLKIEIESPMSTRSKHKEIVESSIETRAKHKEVVTENPTNEIKHRETKSKQKEPEASPHESTRSKHKIEPSESPVEVKKTKLKENVSSTPIYESTRSRHRQDSVGDTSKSKQKEHNNPGPKTEVSDNSIEETKVVEAKLDSPIIISEDSRSQDSGSCIIIEDAKDPLADIPVFKITAESVQTLTPKQESTTSTPSTTPSTPTPRKRGRPRKVPIVVREDFKEQEDSAKSENPKAETKEEVPQVVESGRPKRSCRGQNVRATLGIKPRKPRGPGRGRGSKRGMGTRGVPMKQGEEPKLSKAKLKLLLQESLKEVKTETVEREEEKNQSPKQETVEAETDIKKPAPPDTPPHEVLASSVKTVPTTPPLNTLLPPAIVSTNPGPTTTSPKSTNPVTSAEVSTSDFASSNPGSSTASTSRTESAEIVMVDEETRMSADTNSRAQTPAKQVVPADAVIEESQSSVQSTGTTESGKAASSRPNKAPRLEVQEPEGAVISADQLTEYYWNGNGPFMLQEQVAQFLGIKSFKRKYPGIMRRMLDMQERDFIRESGLASEHMCDLGLTAVNSADILDIMYSDFQDKYEEYCKHQRDRQAKELINKQKALSLAASQEKNKADITEQAVQSAAQWNALFNKTRREERKACMDLQTYTVQYPKGKMKQINKGKVGNYPVSLVPGQFTDYYKEFTPTELNNLPLNTMCYDPINIIPPETSDDSGSDGSDSDSDSSSSSSGSGSDSSSGVEDCKLCKHSPKKVAISK